MPKQTKYVTVDPENLRKIFDKYDWDKSGYLDANEAAAALTQLGSKIAFEDLDSDGDNRISFDEFLVFSQVMGKHTHPVFKSASANTSIDGASKTGISLFAGNAHMNRAFMQVSSKAWRTLASVASYDEASLLKVFKAIDTNDSGTLSEGEIRVAIRKMAPQLTSAQVSVMLATADKDADAAISFDEFVDLMMHDHEKDIKYWEAYGARDMGIGLKDRTGEKKKKLRAKAKAEMDVKQKADHAAALEKAQAEELARAEAAAEQARLEEEAANAKPTGMKAVAMEIAASRNN